MKPYYIYNVDGKTVISYERPSFKMAENGYIFVDKNENITFVQAKAVKEESKQSLPDEPIDVASMLINATITVQPDNFGSLSPLHDKEPQVFSKYDANQLREIAEHLLVYCDTQERGYADACCENSEL